MNPSASEHQQVKQSLISIHKKIMQELCELIYRQCTDNCNTIPYNNPTSIVVENKTNFPKLNIYLYAEDVVQEI